MVALADQNGKTYESKYGTYDTAEKFRFNENAGKLVEKKGYRELFDILIHENLWKLQQPPIKKMSLQDIERELGYRVQIIDPQPGKEEVDKEHKTKVDNTVQFFKDFFGMDLDAEDYY